MVAGMGDVREGSQTWVDVMTRMCAEVGWSRVRAENYN